MKEALKLALEALENHCGNYKLDDEGVKRFVAACNAIEEALAQDEQSSSQEPVAKVVSTAPDRIWLDLGFDPQDEYEVIFHELHDVTWSQDNASGNGIEYVRADTTPPKRPWVGLTKANIQVLIEQARIVPKKLPCPDYNERLLMLTNAVLQELNT